MDAHALAYLIAGLFAAWCVLSVALNFIRFIFENDHKLLADLAERVSSLESWRNTMERQ